MANRRSLYTFALLLAATWLGWSVLVDFFIIPTVFRTVGNFFEAGDLGIAVFSKLNGLELVASSALVLTLLLLLRSQRKSWPLATAAILGWVIVLVYFSYLTPKLTHLTDLWKAAEAAGRVGVSGISDVQQEHQVYHKLYISLDTLKMVLLLFILAAGLYREKDWA